jgi:hypothetical protein
MKLRWFKSSRGKCHILAALIIICSAALFFYQHIFCDGMLFYVDMNFTDPPLRNLELRLSTWDMYGSYTTLPHLQRIPWVCLFLLPSLLLNLSTRTFLFFMFVGTLSLIGLNMYVLTYSLARRLYSESPPTITTIGSLIAAFVYMFNPVAIQNFWAYWVAPAYSFLPLVPLMAKRLFKHPTLTKIATCSLAMALSLTSPHFIIWSFLLFGAMYGFLLVTTRATPRMTLQRFIAVVGVVVVYLLLSAYWLFPYVASGAPGPSSYAITPGMVSAFSGDTINIWRLTGVWSRFLIDPGFVGISGDGMSLWQLSPMLRDPMIATDPAWIVGGFVVSAMAGMTLLRSGIRQNIYLVFFGLVLVVSILLAQGTKSVVPFYGSLFTIPVIKTVSWVFRIPQRWEFFTALSLAVLSGVAVIGFLTDISATSRRTRPFLGLILVLFITAVGYYFYPIVKVHANTVFKPADIPEDYQTVKHWLEDRSGKVAWFPPPIKAGLVPTWDTTKRYNIGLIWLVEHPTISTYMSGRNASFFSQAQATIGEQDWFPFGEISAVLGSRYVILDKSAIPTSEFAYLDRIKTRRKLLSDPGLQIVLQTEFLTVLESKSYIGEVFTADRLTVIDSLDELFKMPRLNVSNSVPVLRTDIQQLPLPASLAPDGRCVSCPEAGESRVTSYQRRSATAYTVSVRTDKPFLLVVTESHDPLWTAVVNDEKEYTSIPVSGIVNGYWIEETGELEIRVEYRGQRTFATGSKLSIPTAILLGAYWMSDTLSQLWRGRRQRQLHKPCPGGNTSEEKK